MRQLRRLLPMHIVLILVAIIMLAPFAFMVSTSFKHDMDVYAYPIKWIPSPAMFGNYVTAWTQLGYFRLVVNSVFVALSATVISLLVNAMAGYAFARKKFPGKRILFIAVLGSMMVPFQAILIPLFLVIKGLRFYNTYAAIIIPWCASGYGIFLMRQYISTIPLELDHAAQIDGCSDFMIFFRVILPLCKPILVSLGIFVFIWVWTDLLLPLIMTRSPGLQTLELGLSHLGGKYGGARINIPVAMAACTMAVIPPIVCFIVGGRTLMRGELLKGGIKG